MSQRVLLLGASGRIGSRITDELLDRGHEVTGVSRGVDLEVDDPDFEAVAADATDLDDVARLAEGHDVVASALGPGEDGDPRKLIRMAEAVVEGLRDAGVDRLVWVGGAGGLFVDEDTRLVEKEDFPDQARPIAVAHVHAFQVIEDADDLDWSYVAPAAYIEPGERTGEYRSAEGELVVDDDGESYITMEDYAIAFVDELEDGDAIHTKLGVGY